MTEKYECWVCGFKGNEAEYLDHVNQEHRIAKGLEPLSGAMINNALDAGKKKYKSG